MSLSQPLGLHKHLTQPSRGLDIVPLFDVLLIALMLTLLSSRFIFAPGISIDLPRASTASAESSEAEVSIAVLTLLKDNSLIYGGRLLSVENFEREAQNGLLPIPLAGGAAGALASTQAGSAAPVDGAEAAAPVPQVLLVKSDASVSLGAVLRVMNAARLAGYDRVQIAEQVSRGQNELIAPQLR